MPLQEYPKSPVPEMEESQGNTAAIHNLAVLHHLTELDFELRSQSEPLSEADQASRDISRVSRVLERQPVFHDPRAG